MVRKKVDNRVRTVIENAVAANHRSFLVIVGDHGKDQIPNLHYILSKSVVKARPNVLWCYKKELNISKNKKKKMKYKKEMKQTTGNASTNGEDPFDVFVSTTNIRYCYYAETHKILGNTFGMLVLQDFEAITPNLLARTIETVEGGGLVVLLLKTMTSLKQLYTMSMDVHNRFRGANGAGDGDGSKASDVVCRFNERFLLSLAKCDQCLVMDDELNVLPVSSASRSVAAIERVLETPEEVELREFKVATRETDVAGVLIERTKSYDQAKSVLTFIDAISEKTLRSTVTLTAGRGRGKSASLGLAIAAAVAFGYSNIFVSSPSPENLVTLFQFVFKGFDALDYTEHVDYDLVKSTNPEFNDAIVRVNIFRTHRQTIQYIQPQDYQKLGQAELVVVDEAAAIPLAYVKNLLGPYLVFLSSTINGYEGTGRSLSLKLIKQLREQSGTSVGSANSALASVSGRVLREITLTQPIRYSSNDPIERWLNELLCLDATVTSDSVKGCPHPSDCQLYYVNRDTLFSYHRASEAFLQRLVGLFVASHYKNSPNDLLLMSDSPDHHLFVLLGPMDDSTGLPAILCAVQVSLEGAIAKEAILNSIKKGYQSAGDLIPWTLTQHFQDEDFPRLSGARIVRIATHPDYQKMGYGSKALDLLTQYYQGDINTINEDQMDDEEEEDEEDEEEQEDEEKDIESSTDSKLQTERIKPKKNLPPLLYKLTERKPELLHYMGVSYGVTSQLYQFWTKSKYLPVYLRLASNEITGEHTCIMLRELKVAHQDTVCKPGWLSSFYQDFRKRFINLLGYEFRHFTASLSLNILQDIQNKDNNQNSLSYKELDVYFSSYDLKRLESYCNNIVDYNVIVDMLPNIGKLIFTNQLDEIRSNLSLLQMAVLLALSLQHKTTDQLATELGVQHNQVMSVFGQAIRRIYQALKHTKQQSIDASLPKPKKIFKSKPMIAESLDDELEAESQKIKEKLIQQGKQLEEEDEVEEQEKEEEEEMVAPKPVPTTVTKKTTANTKKTKEMELEDVLGDEEMKQFLIKGEDADWDKALSGNKKLVNGKVPTSISIASQKRKKEDDEESADQEMNEHQKVKKSTNTKTPNNNNSNKKIKGGSNSNQSNNRSLKKK